MIKNNYTLKKNLITNIYLISYNNPNKRLGDEKDENKNYDR
jgi:hypothetical protein